MDAVARCVSLGGVASTSELRVGGCRREEISAAVDSGSLIRVRRGTYASPQLPAEAIVSLSHGGPLCCASAARAHGLWVLDDERRVHVWLGPNGRSHAHGPCSCVPHRDAARPGARTIVDVTHALLQLLGCLGAEPFFAALESALRLGKLNPRDLRELRRRVPRAHQWLVDLARWDADSGLESLLRLRLHRRGITLASQVRIGGVGVVDFVLGDRLILEADGETHGGEGRHRDLVRDAVALTLGFITLRYDYALIVHEWELVEQAVLSALRINLHRSSTAAIRTIEL